MLKNRRWATALSLILLSAMMFPFQNCAPIDPSSLEEMGQYQDPELRISDGWSQSKVSFIERAVDILEPSSELELVGTCSQSQGAVLYFQVVDVRLGSRLESGETLCDQGGFKLALKKIDGLDCQSNYEVMITSMEGEDDVIAIRKSCDL
ncbi:MAG: hypothetical protein KDD61_00890 [Bdellovibrionales bacterium]|nr:hypothetical protein [Bdellovibrionales bacterium]